MRANCFGAGYSSLGCVALGGRHAARTALAPPGTQRSRARDQCDSQGDICGGFHTHGLTLLALFNVAVEIFLSVDWRSAAFLVVAALC